MNNFFFSYLFILRLLLFLYLFILRLLLFCHWFILRLLLFCNWFILRLLLFCQRFILRLLLFCYWFILRLLLFCHWFIFKLLLGLNCRLFYFIVFDFVLCSFGLIKLKIKKKNNPMKGSWFLVEWNIIKGGGGIYGFFLRNPFQVSIES